MHLPIDFVSDIRSLMGEQRFSIFAEALDQVAPVSIRLNQLKTDGMRGEWVGVMKDGISMSGRNSLLIHCSMPEVTTFRKPQACFYRMCCTLSSKNPSACLISVRHLGGRLLVHSLLCHRGVV